jgi:hypothetical protein
LSSTKVKVKSYILTFLQTACEKTPSGTTALFEKSRWGNQRQIPFSDFSPPCEKSSGGTLRKNSRSDPRPTTFPEFLRRRGVLTGESAT